MMWTAYGRRKSLLAEYRRTTLERERERERARNVRKLFTWVNPIAPRPYIAPQVLSPAKERKIPPKKKKKKIK